MADLEKIGQAFSGGANVLAGGLMDKYQRKRDMEEWEKKTDYAAGIEERQRKALHDLQVNDINHRAFLDMKKKEFETDPELFPVWQLAQGGDEGARNMLETTSEFRHFVDMGIPLTAAQVERLIDQGTPIPPGVRSRILAGHLKASTEEQDKETERERKKLGDKLTAARIADLEKRTKQVGAEDESNLYDYRASEKAREEQKKKDIAAVVKEINDLNSEILSTRAAAERAGASKTKAGYDPLFEEVQHLAGLRDEAIARRDALRPSSAAQARQKWATEAEARTAAPATPVNEVENIALTPEDMKEIAAAKAARPDLSEEEIIRAYVAYKRKTKSPAKGLSPTAGLRER